MLAKGARLALILSIWLLSGPFAAAAPNPIDIRITTHLGDRQNFVDGDRLSFLLSLDKDAFVYLFYRDAGGNLLQLLPNERMPRHYFDAGLFMPVPNETQPFQFEVAPPYGDETLHAIASDNGDLYFPGQPLQNGLILLQDDIDAIGGRIEKGSVKIFGRADLMIKTVPASQAN